MNNEKINSFSLSTMVFSLCSSAFYGTFSSYILYKTKTDSLISIIIGFIISIFISRLILHLYNTYPEKNIVIKNKIIFKNFSIIINIIFFIFAILSYILLTYRLASFLSSQYLIQTPNYIILLIVIFITYYISSKKMETTIRVSAITFFISIIIFIFDFVSLIHQINLQNFLPLFHTSFKEIIKTSFIFSLYFSIPLVNINAINSSQISDHNFNKKYYIMVILSFIIIFLNIFTTIGISGIEINNLFDYPIYTTLKRIKLFSFLDSIENVSIMLWILFIINASNMSLLFANSIILNSFKNINMKVLNIIISIICIVFSTMVFKNGFVESFEYIIIPFIMLLTILVIEMITYIKKRTNGS